MKYYSFAAKEDRNCEVKLFASPEIYKQIENTALKQLLNASKLPGAVSVVGLPDIHQGYGLPIGGVLACDLEEGIVSPGAVGFDINCGVRLLSSNLQYSQAKEHLGGLINEFRANISAGLGGKSKFKFSKQEFKKIVSQGLPFLIGNFDFGDYNDIKCTEEEGQLDNANPEQVSNKALKRGRKQLATLGSGNHFIEIQVIEKLFVEEERLEEGQIVFMIHTGSRGFGHQIAKDYIKSAKDRISKYDFQLPNKNLASFPIQSPQGHYYLQAMACAANFAFANRQLLTHQLRNLVSDFLGGSTARGDLKLYYDLAHNIVKKESHLIEDTEKELLVHRKGATKLAPGGVALIPGSMGTASYIVQSASSESNQLSLESVAHGAGRKMSRRQAKQDISREEHLNSIKGVTVVSGTNDKLLDESPLAYKDISLVIDSLVKTGLAEPIAKLKPLATLKG
ncbi:RtcB family protein [Fuchsiella alkaliacetigena]|uniref:RtcB family protein n=1 Tax=Fuchsiella alkaliacetigena TaxID=957042 RepID=UPI00200B3C90|nr:RtcB family protein [Fuchsiella alkaliacetigena]